MGGIAIDLLPRDSELARRAAGGDGTAFVRLYDRYSADVFETALSATGSVEAAAEATQTAFLTLLRRPPAIDAADDDVMHRLRAMALAADVGRRAASGAGVGWLRSETVAQAGARFDDDWSPHLVATAEGRRTAAEVVRAWHDADPERAEGVISERPVAEPVSRHERRRRFRLRAALPGLPALPSPAARTGVPAVGLAAAALALVLAGGGDDARRGRDAQTLVSMDAASLSPLSSIDGRDRRGRTRTAVRDRHVGGGQPRPAVHVGDDAPSLTPAASGAPHVSPRPPGAGQTLGVTREAAPDGGERVDGPPPPATVEPAPPPPATAPVQVESAPTAPEPAPTPAEPAPAAPAPTQGGGLRRNCNSRRSTSPC